MKSAVEQMRQWDSQFKNATRMTDSFKAVVNKSIDDIDPIRGDLRKLFTDNATERYIADDSDTEEVMYLFSAIDLLYCFLSKQERLILTKLNNKPQTAKELCLSTGIPTKNLAAIIKQMSQHVNIEVSGTIKRKQYRLTH